MNIFSSFAKPHVITTSTKWTIWNPRFSNHKFQQFVKLKSQTVLSWKLLGIDERNILIATFSPGGCSSWKPSNKFHENDPSPASASARWRAFWIYIWNVPRRLRLQQRVVKKSYPLRRNDSSTRLKDGGINFRVVYVFIGMLLNDFRKRVCMIFAKWSCKIVELSTVVSAYFI